jgi:hypothetical protein
MRCLLAIAAPDAMELERLSNGRQSDRRQLIELEEKHVAQTDYTSQMMAVMTAQIQALL